jgi:secondary thiamine-phosphate synthase enzyme
MSTSPKIHNLDASDNGAQPSSQGNYKVFNRIVDWITSDRMQLLNITDRMNDLVRKSGVRDGIIHLQSLHTTTAVFLNEWQDALLGDVKEFFDGVVEQDQYYTTDTTTRSCPTVNGRMPTPTYAAC